VAAAGAVAIRAMPRPEAKPVLALPGFKRDEYHAMRTINELCDLVRETAYAIHRYHGHGHLEKVYENALGHRLRRMGLEVRQQHPLTVFDEDGTVIGEYFADLFVDRRLIVELKTARGLAGEHVAQILGYLKASRIEHGLLINFGTARFEIKKYILNDQGREGRLADVDGDAASMR
jgi:GxxExxY protein